MQGKMQKIMKCFFPTLWHQLEEDGSHVVSDSKSFKDVSFSSVAKSCPALVTDDVYHLQKLKTHQQLR